MIKEIEVGGVKHSITLADDMVGSGLQKDSGGLVSLNVFNKSNALNLSTGLTFTSEGELCLNMEKVAGELAGSGLTVQGGRLIASGEIVDVNTICGTGLDVGDGKLTLSTGIVGSGLVMSPSKVINVAFSKLIDYYGGGLKASFSGLSVNAGSGLSSQNGLLSIDYDLFEFDSFEQIYGPLTRVGVRVTSGLEIYPGYGLKVKIAHRSSGLRLILNEKGELDVTQN